MATPGRGWPWNSPCSLRIGSPTPDMNPDPHGAGLKLNISESDNAQDLDLLREVAPYFRLDERRVAKILAEVSTAVRDWQQVAEGQGFSGASQDRMRRAFRLVM